MEDKKVMEIPIENIVPNPYQPRKVFSDSALEELSKSIQEYGVLQPITVRQKDNGYELVAGERRLRAAKLAKLETIPAIINNIKEYRRKIILDEEINTHKGSFPFMSKNKIKSKFT